MEALLALGLQQNLYCDMPCCFVSVLYRQHATHDAMMITASGKIQVQDL